MTHYEPETVTHWKKVSEETTGAYRFGIYTCQIDVGMIMLTVVEREGVFVHSHQTILTKKAAT